MLAHWLNSQQVDVSPHSDTLSNFIVFGLAQMGFEPTNPRSTELGTNLQLHNWCGSLKMKSNIFTVIVVLKSMFSIVAAIVVMLKIRNLHNCKIKQYSSHNECPVVNECSKKGSHSTLYTRRHMCDYAIVPFQCPQYRFVMVYIYKNHYFSVYIANQLWKTLLTL